MLPRCVLPIPERESSFSFVLGVLDVLELIIRPWKFELSATYFSFSCMVLIQFSSFMNWEFWSSEDEGSVSINLAPTLSWNFPFIQKSFDTLVGLVGRIMPGRFL